MGNANTKVTKWMKDKQNMNRRCFCNRKLKKYNYDPSWSDNRCLSCFNLTEGVHYGCHENREDCLFYEVTAMWYSVCADCFSADIDAAAEDEEETSTDSESVYSENQLFIYRKTRASIQRIS